MTGEHVSSVVNPSLFGIGRPESIDMLSKVQAPVVVEYTNQRT